MQGEHRLSLVAAANHTAHWPLVRSMRLCRHKEQIRREVLSVWQARSGLTGDVHEENAQTVLELRLHPMQEGHSCNNKNRPREKSHKGKKTSGGMADRS